MCWHSHSTTIDVVCPPYRHPPSWLPPRSPPPLGPPRYPAVGPDNITYGKMVTWFVTSPPTDNSPPY
jgi:hypothetical protein